MIDIREHGIGGGGKLNLAKEVYKIGGIYKTGGTEYTNLISASWTGKYEEQSLSGSYVIASGKNVFYRMAYAYRSTSIDSPLSISLPKSDSYRTMAAMRIVLRTKADQRRFVILNNLNSLGQSNIFEITYTGNRFATRISNTKYAYSSSPALPFESLSALLNLQDHDWSTGWEMLLELDYIIAAGSASASGMLFNFGNYPACFKIYEYNLL